jgi:hypothetical protein
MDTDIPKELNVSIFYNEDRSSRFLRNVAIHIPSHNSGVPRNFFRGEVQQIQLRTEDRENGDLGVVAP